jgi:hypothetical protein
MWTNNGCEVEERWQMARRKPKPRLKRERRPSDPPGPVAASFVKPDIHREIRYITQLAQAEDARLVRVGNLVLFSTRTRDAWLLDVEDHYAICLLRDGEPQPFRIVDSPSTFAIEWTARFTMDGAAFIVEEQSGRVAMIHGYPVVEIAAARRGR